LAHSIFAGAFSRQPSKLLKIAGIVAAKVARSLIADRASMSALFSQITGSALASPSIFESSGNSAGILAAVSANASSKACTAAGSNGASSLSIFPAPLAAAPICLIACWRSVMISRSCGVAVWISIASPATTMRMLIIGVPLSIVLPKFKAQKCDQRLPRLTIFSVPHRSHFASGYIAARRGTARAHRRVRRDMPP
jgi:hypothetical protein